MLVIVFDFDGVFIDTEILKTKSYFDCLTDAAGAYKVSVKWEEYLHEHPVGSGRPEVCKWIIKRFNIKQAAEDRARVIKNAAKCGTLNETELGIYSDNLENYDTEGKFDTWKAIAFDRGVLYEGIKDQAPLIGPAKDFLLALRKGGGQAGLVTRTKRDVLASHLVRIDILEACFSVIVCEDDLPADNRTKASMYKQVCDQLGVQPSNAIAVEDTDKGVEGAKIAGIGLIVAVPTLSTKKQDFLSAGAHIVVATLTTLADSRLKQLPII